MTTMPGERKITASDVRSRFDELMTATAATAPKRDQRLWPYYEAAAVVPAFRPADLSPVEHTDATRVEALRALVSDCVPDEVNGEVAWRLRGDIRRSILQRMSETDVKRAVAATSRLTDDPKFGATLQALRSGAVSVADLTTLDDITRALALSQWLDVSQSVQQDLRRRLELFDLLQPFQKLVGNHFRGRAAQLQKLSSYVGVQSRAKKTRVPLSVSGPGGVGKSTLIARFILDHSSAVEEGRLAFAYIDADRPTVEPEDPRLLVIEIARQLAVQFPDAPIDVQALRDKFTSLTQRGKVSPIRNPAVRQVSITALLDTLKSMDVPLLLVFDTFERIQTRSSVFAVELGKFVAELQAAWPLLRPVFVGRAPITDFKTEPIHLENLDVEAATGFLQAHGITDTALAEKLVSQLGGNPLTLRLAAELVHAEPIDAATGIRDVSTTQLFFMRLDERLIQGQLYRRILNHISDLEVRKLAHPGLAVRRVTPAVIHRVLAVPCELDVPNIDAARNLFNRFAREVSLVEQDPDGGVRHRPDVRKVMLRLLVEADPKGVVPEIHRRAVAFYRREKGTRARAEEIYHRLMLEEPADKIDPIWRDTLAVYLNDAVDELPPASRAYLASRLGEDLDDDLRRHASLLVWESAAANKAGDLLRLGRPDEALALLRERRERSPASPIHLLELRALRELDRKSEALALVQATLTGLRGTDREFYLQLAQQGAELAESIGDMGRALDLLAEAAAVTRAMGDARLRLRLALKLHRVRVAAGIPPNTAEEETILHLYRNLPRTMLTSEPLLTIDTAVALGHRSVGLLYDAVLLARSASWPDARLDQLQTIAIILDAPDLITSEIAVLYSQPMMRRGKLLSKILTELLNAAFPPADIARDLMGLIREALLEAETSNGLLAARRVPVPK